MSFIKGGLLASFVDQIIYAVFEFKGTRMFLNWQYKFDMIKKNSTALMLLRFALGTGFILPVLDRLGFLGIPGSANVSWGNWTNFVAYANNLMPYLSTKMASFFGLIATIAEALFGILLIIGYKIKLAAYGSFVLALIFALSMLFFVGYRSPFDYSVFVVSFSSLVLASLAKKESQKN
jgi:putative oxidoreductase